MWPPEKLVRLLDGAGFNFFTGVPCSLVKGVIAYLEERGTYVPETREDAALGLAAGAFLAGKRPVVLMQNSGLGVCLNALTSLHLLYHIPCLLLVTWRGFEGQDAPEHLMMGEVTTALLKAVRLPHRILTVDNVRHTVRWAAGVVEGRLPAVLLLPPRVLQ